MHNLIVRMHQSRYFRDEAGGGHLITAFVEKDEQERNEAAIEYEANWRRIKYEVNKEWEEVVQWIVNDKQHTDFEAFAELEVELIRYHG